MRPATEEDVADLVRAATEPLAIRGGGTRGPLAAGAVLDTTGLAGVHVYEPGALTLVAGAGTPLCEIEALLSTERQRLPFEPPDLRGLLGTMGEPTLGGMVATNATGPRRVLAGACRDALIGARFVDGTGAVVQSGGRVMKNVTGYDLARLMAGAGGALGVLTQVAFKLLPLPEAEVTLVLPGLSPDAAVSAMIAALASPWEVSGAAHLPDGRCLLRLEGFEQAINGRVAKLAAALGVAGADRVQGAQSAALWRMVRDVAPFHDIPGDVWRVICRPSDAAALAARTADAGGTALIDWGGGLVWLRVPAGTDLAARLGAFTGHARPVRGAGASFPVPDPALVALRQGLRARFDPRGIFNVGVDGANAPVHAVPTMT